jgi:5'-phosphate synthase pdxT subunit
MVVKRKRVGILALQGDYEKHKAHLERAGVETVYVRYPEQLKDIDGLVIPGGESTTIGKLLVRQGLLEPLKERIEQGLPVLGTCAGAILLAKEIKDGLAGQPRLAVVDITAIRNAYGRQVESFELDIAFPVLGEKPLRCVFIRAPMFEIQASDALEGAAPEVLGTLGNNPIFIRQHNIIIVSFHPELTDDLRLHQYFLEIIQQKKA